jgi:hypothetical protein
VDSEPGFLEEIFESLTSQVKKDCCLTIDAIYIYKQTVYGIQRWTTMLDSGFIIDRAVNPADLDTLAS